MDTNFRRRLDSTLFIVGFFVLWEALCWIFHVSDIVLPKPSQIIVTLVERMPALWPHAVQTLYTTLIGFGFGIIIGISLGVLVGSSRLAYDVAYPLLIGFATIPKVAVVPIFVLWFGAGTVPAILTAMIMSIFPIVVNVATGLATTEPELEDVMRALHASKLDILWNVGLPRTMPYFFASLKVAVTLAFVGTVISETVASNRGIGNVMMIASSNFDVPLVFAGLLILAAMGIALYAVFSLLDPTLPDGPIAKTISRWVKFRQQQEFIVRFVRKLAALAVVSLCATSAVHAQGNTKIRFTLDWKLQGIHAWYFWAQAKNYFAAEHLDVTIDQGEGSAMTVTRIMSGAYDAGFGDTNAVIQTAAKKPGEAPLMVYMIYSKAPFALVTKTTGPIVAVKDLAGHKVGSSPGGASLQLLPLLLKKNGVDPSTVSITQIAPNLQEQILIQGQVDAAAVFTATSYMNLIAQKLDPDKDFRWLYYADSGIDLYSNGIMVSQALAKEHPEAVRGLVRAINRALKETMADPNGAIDLLAQTEPLLNKDIEKRRLIYVYKTLIDTPESRALGIGDASDARLTNSIATIAESYSLPRTPQANEVFDRSFLPPKSERMPITLTN